MFRLNFGLKPVFGFKPWFQTLVLTKDKVTQCLGKIAEINEFSASESINQSINQSTGLFVWQLKSWIVTCTRLEL